MVSKLRELVAALEAQKKTLAKNSARSSQTMWP